MYNCSMSLRGEPTADSASILVSLPGADNPKKEGRVSIFALEDRERWNEVAIPRLTKEFGKTVMHSYVTDLTEFEAMTPEEQWPIMVEQCKISFENIDDNYVIAEGKEPVGYLTTENYSKYGDTAVLRDIVVKESARHKGNGGELYRAAFTNGKFDGLIGYTRTPEAVNLRIRVGDECDFGGYAGSMGSEKLPVRIMEERTREYLRSQNLLDESIKLPHGFVAIKRESVETAVFPVDQVDIKGLPPSDVLNQFNLLNKLQQEEIDHVAKANEGLPKDQHKLPSAIAMTLTSIRE